MLNRLDMALDYMNSDVYYNGQFCKVVDVWERLDTANRQIWFTLYNYDTHKVIELVEGDFYNIIDKDGENND